MGPMRGMGDPSTLDFITKASQSDLFEIHEGRLAAQRSHNPHIRRFASLMVSAHTKTTQGLKAAIRRSGLAPPPPPMLTDDQRRMMDDLKAAHGPDFDKTYIDQQVQAHQMTLNVVQAYVQTGRPGPIHDAAEATLPIVQHHLDMARDIQAHLDR
jgi:putative membrane protein